jgi:hypothetical protein
MNRLLLRIDSSKVDVKFLIALLERLFPQGSDNYNLFTEHLVDELFETFNERDLDKMPAEFRVKVFQYLDILENLGIFLDKFEGAERQENGITIIDYYYEPKTYSDLMQIFP